MIWWRRDKQESALDKELRFHIEERVAHLKHSGLTEEEARRMVFQEFGAMEHVREECRDVRPGRWLERLIADLKLAFRGLRKNPSPALTIILTVAVCVAVNTAVFTVVDSLLLRPLPFEAADRLIVMSNQYPKAGITDQEESAAADYIDRESTMPAVAEHALYRFVTHPVDRGGVPVQMAGIAVSASFFPLLRVKPAEGRLFTEADTEVGKHRSVILTDGLWREMFGAAPALGTELRISGRSYLVAGILPPGFRFIAADARYFIPLPLSDDEKSSRHSNSFRYVARLRDGATAAQAQAQVNALNARLLQEFPTYREILISAGFYTRVEYLQPWLMRRVRYNLQLLWAGALLVLLVGAVNIAGLSLARAVARARELATRVALGATNGDLVRQFLIESILPALLGGILGIAGGLLLLRLFDSGLLPGAAEIKPEPFVILYALGGALFAGCIAGIASLIPLRKLELARAIHDGSRGGTARSVRLRRVFVTAQVALAFVLLNAAGVLTASIRELWRVNPGFRVNEVWTASTYLPEAAYPQPAELRTAVARLTTAIGVLPGIESAGAGSAAPFERKYDDNVVFAEDHVMQPGESAISPIRLYVTPGYLQTLGVDLIAGRPFDARDNASSPPVVIVDQRLADRFWPGRNPVGRRMYYPAPEGKPKEWLTVIGVSRSVRLQDLAGTGNPNGVYYIPYAQNGWRSLTIVWRGKSDSVAALQHEFARLAPSAALFDIRSMSQRQELTLAARRVAQTLVLVFAGVAVLLTAIGIHGLLGFLVTQRRREIGIRLSIGCKPSGVYRLFLWDGLMLVAAGLLAGAAIATTFKPWVTHQLYGITAMEPAVLVVVAAVLVFVAVIAISLPAWRAARIDPVSVLGEI